MGKDANVPTVCSTTKIQQYAIDFILVIMEPHMKCHALSHWFLTLLSEPVQDQNKPQKRQRNVVEKMERKVVQNYRLLKALHVQEKRLLDLKAYSKLTQFSPILMIVNSFSPVSLVRTQINLVVQREKYSTLNL